MADRSNRKAKWEAIRRFVETGVQDPGRLALLSFLAGRLERVRLMRSLEFSDIGVKLSTRRSGLWPRVLYEGFIRGVPIPDPILFIAAMVDDDAPIDVVLDFDGVEEAEWYARVAYRDARDPRLDPERAKVELRAAIDRALDIYQAAREQFDPSFVEMARRDIERLSAELRSLSAAGTGPAAEGNAGAPREEGRDDGT
ncbi:hypothetical protein [Hydrogenibacillus sp. N12]|uniref:hypothetical protein n=1 Tax=Hydrogenibacillus sp. N12 TaxID=2866627 RepID=UPI001C7DA0F4|nr:hypothetical protein [Hydrogenibacillus sp. N12]QZA32213.1 hypothetical protein K2M58_07695 [Hydrogenibacillus sp. N12]